MSDDRLNQLKFPDETKAGLALVSAYILLDAARSPILGGHTVLLRLGVPAPEAWQVGSVQLMALVIGALVLLAWRVVSVRRALRPVNVEAADRVLTDDVSYLAHRLAGRKPQFLLTANVTDGNAFCLPTLNGPWVVLGGGLRILTRRNKDQARAIVAHECAHVEAGDTLFVVVTWAVFCAYAGLVATELLLHHVPYWWKARETLAQFHARGEGFLEMLRWHGLWLLRAGFPGLISLAGLALVLSHFTRTREYRADERTRQFGLGAALGARLQGLTDLKSVRLKDLLAFHPPARARAQRLARPDTWGKVDWWFAAGFALLTLRLESRVPSADSTQLPELEGMDVSAAIDLLVKDIGANPWQLLDFVVEGGLAMVLVLHLYRVFANGWEGRGGLPRTLWQALGVYLAVFAGGFAGDLTSDGTLSALFDSSSPWAFKDAVEAAFASTLNLAMVCAIVALAVPLVVPDMLKRPARVGWRHVAAFAWRIAIAAFVVQVLFSASLNAFSIASNFMQSGQEVPLADWWTVMVVPTAAELFLFIAGSLFVLPLIAALVARFRTRKARPAHPSWKAA